MIQNIIKNPSMDWFMVFTSFAHVGVSFPNEEVKGGSGFCLAYGMQSEVTFVFPKAQYVLAWPTWKVIGKMMYRWEGNNRPGALSAHNSYYRSNFEPCINYRLARTVLQRLHGGHFLEG
jgi:hypothetical protein